MPNQCIHCSKIYEDGAQEVLKGCSSCGSRFFFYLSQEKLDKINEAKESGEINEDSESLEDLDLSSSDKKQIEKDVREIAGIEDIEAPVILDFESVKVLKPGKYILDIPNLFNKRRPLVYKLEDGKYVIDITSNDKKE